MNMSALGVNSEAWFVMASELSRSKHEFTLYDYVKIIKKLCYVETNIIQFRDKVHKPSHSEYLAMLLSLKNAYIYIYIYLYIHTQQDATHRNKIKKA
jgi:hypothetical protein